MMYSPTGYHFLKIPSTKEPSGFIYKIMGSWDGSYLSGESWRVSSGISKIEDKGSHLYVQGFSGSIYVVRKQGRGLNVYAMGVLQEVLSKAKGIISISTEEIMEVFNEG